MMPSVADLLREIASKLDGIGAHVDLGSSISEMGPIFEAIESADPDTKLDLLDFLIASKDRLCAHRKPAEGAAALRELADELDAVKTERITGAP